MDSNLRFLWKNAVASVDRGALEALELEFRTAFLEAAVKSRPDDLDVLSDLGEIYTRQGRVREGLEIDLRLARLFPDNPTVNYNLACSLALTGQTERAVKALQKAILKGFADFDHLASDCDLATVVSRPEIQGMMSQARKLSVKRS